MADYIKREDAISHPFANGKYDHEHADEHFILGCEFYKEWLESLPSADVVERKRGKWMHKFGGFENGHYINCSACGFPPPLDGERGYTLTHYCPYCGADMRGEPPKGEEE